MLRSILSLKGLTLQAKDGQIGEVEQALFDDEKWTIRYLVVKTGNWLLGKKVLISPISLEKVQWDQNSIAVSLSRKQVEESPDIDADQPVSRQMEQRYSAYYRWPYYWPGAGIWGSGAYPAMLAGMPPAELRPGEPANWQVDQQESLKRQQDEGDIHLRSSKEVIGYKIEATDATFGHIEDFMIDDETWKIRYLVIDTKSFWPSKSVLLPPDWVDSVSWSGRKCRIGLPEKVIQQAPEYDPVRPVDRAFEKRLYGYYGRSGYWEIETPFIHQRRAG